MALDIEWMSDGLCTHRLFFDAWFPDMRTEPIARKALAICRACPVKQQCKTAGKTEKHGIWGGQFRSESLAAGAKRKPKTTPALGSIRRLQALAALGWTGKDVSHDIRRYTGMLISPMKLEALRDDGMVNVPVEVADGIARAFKHLGNTAGHGNNANGTVAHARSLGWCTPREWRGLDIDDPKCSGPQRDEDE